MPSKREIKRRGRTLESLGLKHLDKKSVEYLQNNYEKWLFEELGLALGEDGSVPNSNGVIPRMYYLAPNEQGEDRPHSFSRAPFKLGDPEFFEQIRKGNVFVYPAGEREPVQLQIDLKEGSHPVLRYSKPVQPEQTPLHEAPPLTGWQNFWNFVSGRRLYRRDREKRLRYERERAFMTEKMGSDRDARASVRGKELQELENEKARRERLKINALRINDMEKAKDQMDEAKRGKEQFVSVFKPAPDKLEKLLARTEDHPKGKRENFYNEEQFRDLTILTDDEEKIKQQLRNQDAALKKKYERHPDADAHGKQYKFRTFDQKGIRIGGKSVTDAQFAGLALAACMTSKHVKEAAKRSVNFDYTLEPMLKKMGWNQEECDITLTSECAIIGTTDFFMKARDNEGEPFSYYVNPSRLDAAKALEEYKQGKPEALAQLLAAGVNRIAMELRNFSNSERFDTQVRGAMIMGGELVGLLDQSPDLKKLAEDKGMKPERLSAIRGAAKIIRMEQEAWDAQYLLAKTRADGGELNREQKRSCAEKLLRAKLALATMRSARAEFEERQDTEYYRAANELVPIEPPKRMVGNPPIPVVADKKEWPQLPEGQVYGVSYQSVLNGMIHRQMPIPDFPAKLLDPVQAGKFENVVQQIVKQEHLEDKSVEELFRDLKFNAENSQLDLADSATRARETLKHPAPAKQQNGPVVEEKGKEPLLQSNNAEGIQLHN